MEKMLEVLLVVSVFVASVLANDLIVNDDVLVVNVQRFKGELPTCNPREVCADVFNFTRDHGDGTGRRESRFIQNCYCPNTECGKYGDPLMFKETQTQSMVTCEPASTFRVCRDGEIAKVQNNTGAGIFYQINCVCPNNEFPQNFYNKMTIKKSFRFMTPEEKMLAEEYNRSRFFRCRRDSEYRKIGLFN